MPKFADDLVAVSVGKDVSYITQGLQEATNQLTDWAQKEGMYINTDKTKVMVYGNSTDEIVIKVLENVKHYKYLGVILDHQLNFAMQVHYAVRKAKTATAKIGTLTDGRNGLSVQLVIELYKSLVCPHLQGEHKKVAPPPATFVDISAMSENFCMKFYVTVKQSNIHFITKFG